MHELFLKLLFYIFAGITLISAFMVVIQKNPVRGVLFLVLAFFSSSVLWLMLQAEFLALILVLVYVGAVMTLFLFVVMMLNIDLESRAHYSKKHLFFGLLIVAVVFGFTLMSIPPDALSIVHGVSRVHPGEIGSSLPNTEQIGLQLYTNYVLAFEMAAVLLLVAIVSAITLTHRAAGRSKQQDIVKQIMTRRQDRVSLVSMKPEIEEKHDTFE